MPEEEVTTGEKPKRSIVESIFLGAIFLGSVAVSIYFVIETQRHGEGFPSVIVAVLLGIAVATISYAFLGGVEGSGFKFAAGKLAGAAAVIAAVYFLIAGPLDKNMNTVKDISEGKRAIEKFAPVQGALTDAQRNLKLCNSGLEIANTRSVEACLVAVRDSDAADDLGTGILDIYKDGAGPFKRVVSRGRFKARFHKDVPDGTFWYCSSKNPELAKKNLLFEYVSQPSDPATQWELKAGDDIGHGRCSSTNPPLEFDVQLGCDAAKALLGLQCDNGRGVGWTDATPNKVYDLPVTVMNPTFGPSR
jgi:hypothetical protein